MSQKTRAKWAGDGQTDGVRKLRARARALALALGLGNVCAELFLLSEMPEEEEREKKNDFSSILGELPQSVIVAFGFKGD